MDKDLIDFLRERNLPEENITRIIDEKIDAHIIVLMEDSSLETYIPLYGDRIAVKNFCSEKTTHRGNKKESLINKLKKRLGKVDSSYKDGASSSHLLGNKRAEKTTRKIELAWMHKEGDHSKQVRVQTGGGVRNIELPKTSTMKEILDESLDLFFPGGKSKRGLVQEFDFELLDFQQEPVEKSFTLEKYYDRSKIRSLRFHLLSIPKQLNARLTENKTPRTEDVIKIMDEVDNISDEKSLNSFDEAGAGESVNNIDTMSIDNEVVFQFFDQNYEIEEHNDGTLSDPISCQKLELCIHRGNALMEMISFFKIPDILSASLDIKIVLPNGKLEAGEGSGVFKDCITEFWTSFYENCTIGSNFKIPFLRHDFQLEEWQSVARIIHKGFEECDYVPISLSKVFLEEAIYGKMVSDLFEDYMQYLSESERELVKKALAEFSEVDEDDMFEFLDSHQCRKKVTHENFRSVVLELAHKELIQQPKYVLDCFSPILKSIAYVMTPDDLSKFYKHSEATPKGIIKILTFPDNMDSQEREVRQYLKTYIKESDKKTLRSFLRFCTAIDIIPPEPNTIKVQFSEMAGFTRCPVGHTCGRVLELPKMYENFPSFRAEFNSLLTSDVWVMDII